MFKTPELKYNWQVQQHFGTLELHGHWSLWDDVHAWIVTSFIYIRLHVLLIYKERGLTPALDLTCAPQLPPKKSF
eukprot:6486133-Amphidinium_carterae.2